MRCVREIVGVNSMLNQHWSSRRRAIDFRQGELAAEFQSRHGRPPTAVEAVALAQQATLETRDAKHAPRSEAEQRTLWRAEAVQVLGHQDEVDFMVDAALGHRFPSVQVTGEWVTACAATVIGVLEEHRATWRVWHIRAEAERQARTAGIRLGDLDVAVNRVVDHVLASSVRLGTPDPVTEPNELRRADGVSVYEVRGATVYTSTRVLAAEQRLLATATAGGGRHVDAVRVGVAMAEQAANGITLAPAQAAMVHALASSGARLQVTLAPAGTGKTTAMRVLARAWTDDGGYVLGLAPSARAASELGDAIEGRTETLAKLTWTLRHQPRSEWPGWVDRIGTRTLVVIDEAGQAATTELATAVDFIVSRGGSVRLVGDDQQLAAVGAGGILRDIADRVGAVTLTEVRRFDDPAEAAATLALRDGDPTALGFYADNGRIHVGELATVSDHAYQAWATDRAAGLDSVLLAATRDLVTRLNEQARADRLATDRNRGREVRLTDGTRASVGDTILTRRNARRLVTSTSNWVKNGDRWTVEQVHPDGSMKARHLDHHRSVSLPASYVRDHVQLGYAATVHTAQGLTCDTAHVVATGDEHRQLLYVALSRGRHANHIYLGQGPDRDIGSLLQPEAARPPTAVEILTGILERDGAQHSATTTGHDLDSPATQLHDAVVRYLDALGYAAEQVLGTDTLAALDQQVEAVWPGLTHEPAYPTLRGHLALGSLAGVDPMGRLLDAAIGGLHTAHDRAAVLDWRLNNGGPDGPLPWLPAISPALIAHAEWGPYLQDRAGRVTHLAHQVRHDLTTRLPLALPSWVADTPTAADTELRGDLGVWRAAFGVTASDDGPTGPPQQGVNAAAYQSFLGRRLLGAVGAAATPNACRSVLPEAVRADPYVEYLQQRLNILERAGVNPTALIEIAIAQPQPLPDEHAAGALWWRVVQRVDPAALREATSPAAPQGEPSPESTWSGTIIEAVPAIETNPGWYVLLKTIARIHADGYDIPEVLTHVLVAPLASNERAADDLRYRLLASTEPDPRHSPPAIVATTRHPLTETRRHPAREPHPRTIHAPRR